MPMSHEFKSHVLRSLPKIAERFETPFYIYDAAGIQAGVAELQKAFDWNEGFREFFAVKACPNIE